MYIERYCVGTRYNILQMMVLIYFLISDQPSAEYKVIHDASPGRIISKYDLGKFLIEALSQPEHYGKVCGLTNISNA